MHEKYFFSERVVCFLLAYNTFFTEEKYLFFKNWFFIVLKILFKEIVLSLKKIVRFHGVMLLPLENITHCLRLHNLFYCNFFSFYYGETENILNFRLRNSYTLLQIDVFAKILFITLFHLKLFQ